MLPPQSLVGAGSPELLIITAVRAFDPSLDLDEVADVVVEDGRLTRVGRDAAQELLKRNHRAVVIDGRGHWLVPAFVDMHAHFREPGHEYKEDIRSGLRAAAAGGFAHVCAMPNTAPVNDTRAITEMMVARSQQVGGTRLHPIAAITRGLAGEHLTEVGDLRAAGAVGISDDGRCVTNAAVMRRALEYAKTFDVPVIQHAEDHALTAGAQMHEGSISTLLGLRGWPRVAEDIIVARDILLAETVGARYHVAHVSTAGAVALVRAAKERGVAVSAEVTPHHLMLTHEAVLGYDTLCKVNPPLREASDIQACRAGLADGTIDAIATDHAPHTSLEKDCEFQLAAPGLIGLELVVPVLLSLLRDGHFTLARMVDALTRAPARIVALDAPSLRVGARAELCLIDPEREHLIDAAALHSKSHNSPFVGQTHRGSVELTMAAGVVTYLRAQRSPSA